MRWDDLEGLVGACEGVDAIVHAAGMNAKDCQTDPVAALEFNGVSTARLAQAAIKAGVSRLVYISTAHVYARPLTGVVRENDAPHNPHPYATSHLAGEYAVLSACDEGNMSGTILRLSNAIGAPKAADVDCWMLLFCDLCRQAIVDGALTVRTNALQQRDFVALMDVCSAVEKIVGGATTEFGPHVFNLGSGASITLLDLAQLIQARCLELFGVAPEIKELQSRVPGSALQFDIRRLQAVGYRPVNDFATETDRMLLFCKQAFGAHA